MRQAGGSAATIYSSGGMPVQSAVLNSGTIAAIENADLNSGTIPLLRGAFVPRDFGTAIEGVSLLKLPLLGTIDCTLVTLKFAKLLGTRNLKNRTNHIMSKSQ